MRAATRRKRDLTTADQISIGDLIEPNNNGIRATVDWIGESTNVAEPNVVLHWTYPDDFSVNANVRGQAGGRTYRPGDPITRWL